MQRPFHILGVQQIAIGNADKSVLRHLWIDLFGLHEKGTFRSDTENVDEDILSVGLAPFAVEIDLMQPLRPEGRPSVHEPPLNHIGLWVDDLQAAFQWLTEAGVHFAPGGIRKGASGNDVCFVHPKGAADAPIGGAGVLIELVQAPETLIAALRAKSG